MIILQIENLDPNRLYDVNPYNASAFGVLVVVFVVIIIVLYRKITKLESEYRDVVNTAHEVSRESVVALAEIQNKQELNISKIQGLLHRIIDKIDNIKH